MPADYKVRFLMENASATLEAEDRRLLQSVFRDNIEFDATGLTRFDLIKSCGFVEKGGQPWWKGWIEALFRKLHTLMNLLPGTTGNRYDNKPAELESKCKYCLQVLRAAKRDGVDFGGLRFPLLKYDELECVMSEIVDWLNNRSDHRLQGLDMVDEYVNSATKQRISYRELCALPNSERIGWIAKPRPETPAERWNKLAARERFVRLPQGALLPLYDKTRQVTVRNGRIEISDRRFSNEKLVFTAPDIPVLDREGETFTAGFQTTAVLSTSGRATVASREAFRESAASTFSTATQFSKLPAKSDASAKPSSRKPANSAKTRVCKSSETSSSTKQHFRALRPQSATPKRRNSPTVRKCCAAAKGRFRAGAPLRSLHPRSR